MPRTVGTPNLRDSAHEPLVFTKWMRRGGKMRCQELKGESTQCIKKADTNILFQSLESPLAFCNKHLAVYDPESYDIVPLESRLKPGERRRDASEHACLDRPTPLASRQALSQTCVCGL